MPGGEMDAAGTTLGSPDQQHPLAAGGIHGGREVRGCCLHRRRCAHAIGQADAAAIEQDEAAHLRERRKDAAAARLVPDALDMRHEARHHDDIWRPAADDLIGDMQAATLGIARTRA